MPPWSGRSTITSRPSGGPTTGPQSRSATPPAAVAVDGRASRRAPTLTQTPSGPGGHAARLRADAHRREDSLALVSMRATTPRSGFAATTCAPETATSVTPAPTSKARMASRRSPLTRHTVPSAGAVTHAAPAPTASESTAEAAMRPRALMRLRSRSTRATRPSSASSHTPPSPAATARAGKPRSRATT